MSGICVPSRHLQWVSASWNQSRERSIVCRMRNNYKSITSTRLYGNMKILVVGSINMDLVVRLPRIPKPGETLLGGVFNTYPGGKGANQAVAIARLGGDVTLIGAVGNDPFGDELLGTLQVEGVDTKYIMKKKGVATGVALIEVDAEGQNSIAVTSGANFELSPDDVRIAMDQVGPFDILVMPLETPINTIHTATQIAHSCKAKVILNPAPAQVLSSDILTKVDYLVPNEHEIEIVAGQPFLIPADGIHTFPSFSHLGVSNLIITLGDHGVFYQNKSGDHLLIPAYSVKAVDTTAAGDCFVGALAVSIAEGNSTVEAIKFANAAAALSVTRVGAQPSLPFRGDVDQFLADRRKIQ